MDYELEAYNMIRFQGDMASLENICLADVLPELTRRRVIVTTWVDGLKLSDCSREDVLRLCDSLLNCYLIQLLDTGFLHADPHPGNLLRTPDGKLCILDFGLVSQVEKDQRIHLVEFIAHLSLEDFDAVTMDLIALGFLPRDTSESHLEYITPVIQEVRFLPCALLLLLHVLLVWCCWCDEIMAASVLTAFHAIPSLNPALHFRHFCSLCSCKARFHVCSQCELQPQWQTPLGRFLCAKHTLHVTRMT